MGAIDTTYTFTATDTITSTKMNNIIDQTTFTNDAVFDTTLAVASGKLKVNAQGITSNELASNAVTTVKITNLNVTTEKIADLNVTTGKIADLNVTTGKIANANITASKLDGAQSGSAPIYGCRAWGSFNASASSPITPDGSGNIASIVRIATYSYRVTFTIAMSSDDYAVSFGSKNPLQSNVQAWSPTSLDVKTNTYFECSTPTAGSSSTLITFMVVE